MINNNQPITQERLGTVLVESSNNVHILTCFGHWLLVMLEDEEYEWICQLLSIHIRKLIVADHEVILSDRNLIAFCQTFMNLQEITMELDTPQDLFFLLNTLKQLTMANITLRVRLNDEIHITKWLQQNTILVDFIARKEITEANTSKIILWIGSRRTSN
jgi:hypothetical protein